MDLIDIVRDALDFYDPLYAEKEVDIVLRAPDAQALVYGDRSLLFEGCSNLLDNALKYSPRGQQVDVTVALDPIELEIRDYGPGIDPADVEMLKERYKKQSFKHQAPGFGIGLSIVDSIARLHNISFRLENVNPGCRARLAFKDRRVD
ncbi:sensor histidine kinase [Methylobacterium sp. P31]